MFKRTRRQLDSIKRTTQIIHEYADEILKIVRREREGVIDLNQILESRSFQVNASLMQRLELAKKRIARLERQILQSGGVPEADTAKDHILLNGLDKDNR